MISFPLDPSKLVLQGPGSMEPGSVVYWQRMLLLVTKSDGDRAQRFACLGSVGDLQFPLLNVGVGDCCVLTSPGELRVVLKGDAEYARPVHAEYAGSAVVISEGTFLVCTFGDRFNGSVLLVSLADGRVMDPQEIRLQKPIFVQWSLGVAREGSWHELLDRSQAPAIQGRG